MKKSVLYLMIFAMLFNLISCSHKIPEKRSSNNYVINLSYMDCGDEETVNALEILSSKVNEFSNGEMSLNYTLSSNPMKEMRQGNAEIILMDTEKLQEYDENFKIFTSPFYFVTPVQSTMLLNSEKFYELFNEYCRQKIGCELLSTVYLEGQYLFSEKEAVSDLETAKKTVFILNDNEKAMAELLSANEIDYFGIDEIKDDFYSEDNVAYISSISNLDRYIKGKNKLYISQNPFRVNTQWIMVRADYWDNMTLEQRNVLRQAMSYFSAAAEQERLDEIKNFYYNLSKKRISLIAMDSMEMRTYCHSYVKYHSKLFSGISVDMFNDGLNIIS